MKGLLSNLLFIVFVAVATISSTANVKGGNRITPVPFYDVRIEDKFWTERIGTVNKVTVPFAMEHCKPAVERLKICADYRLGRSSVLPEQHRFISSDLYKCLEGAAYSLQYHKNPEIEARIDEIADIIAEAQQDDGYLYVDHICRNPNVEHEGASPYSWVVHSHELYNVGHLYEAAVAYYIATGKDNLLKIAEKSAKHVNRVFFEGDPNYNGGKPVMQAPGHEEIELALCKLYKATGNNLYLEMAKKFLDIRGVTYRPSGSRTMSPTYAQQHLPVKEQREAVGHAVRAGYLYAAMAEVDALTRREDYSEALDAIWTNLVETRMHITGGLGAVHGIEGFGAEYELPNKNAYNETCAAVANVFFNHRMFLAEGDSRYLDIMELSLFNNSLAGIGLSGDSFFYENPLECDGVKSFNKGGNARASWYGCACCPPNILRLILQSPGYMYAYEKDKIYLTLYAGSSVTVPLEKGDVALVQKSEYPYDGEVRLTVTPAAAGQKFKLYMRIPGWARSEDFIPGGLYKFSDKAIPGYQITVNGKPVKIKEDKGFAVIERSWKAGDVVCLDIPMKGRYVKCDTRVTDNHNRHAIVRGPLVYCAESADNAGSAKIQNYYLESSQEEIEESIFTEGLMENVMKLQFPAMIANADGTETESILTLVPYYTWDNRVLGNTMTVWIPEDKETALNSIPGYGYLDYVKAIYASESHSQRPASAICDGGVASESQEMATAFWSNNSQNGEREEVVIEFNEIKNLSSLSVYWTDRYGGEKTYRRHINRVPESWSVELRINGNWVSMELYVTDSYETELHKFNTVHPAEDVFCDAVKLCIKPYEGYTVGISEVQFDFVD